MKAPGFWWSKSRSVQALALAPLGWIYGRIAGRRMLQKPKGSSSLPVICVGNFVAGGTGKTPFSLMLHSMLNAEGFRCGFLLRGHGGSLSGPVLVDLSAHDAAQVGDEALLLAKAGPTIVSRDRVTGAALAEKQAIDVLLMDDGFQNPDLAKDLRIVLVDAHTGVGNGLCIPAGPLRAPLKIQMLHADVLVTVGNGDGAAGVLHQAGRKGLPILRARLQPGNTDHLAYKPLFAFAGIGRPEKFFQTLSGLGLKLVKSRGYPDHHVFTGDDASDLLRKSEAEGLLLVTTEKDMARISTTSGEIFRWLESKAETLPVTMTVSEPERLKDIIRQMLRARSFQPGRAKKKESPGG